MSVGGSRQASLSSERLSLHVSRVYVAAYAGLGLLMTLMGLFVVDVVSPTMGGYSSIAGWAAIAFFGWATLLFVIQFIGANYFGLTLDTQGFTVRINLGRRRYRWSNVERFFLFYTAAPYPVIVFKYRGSPEVHGLQSTRGLFRSFDGSLPQSLTVRGQPLLDLMEQWRSRYATDATQPSAPMAGSVSEPGAQS